MKHLSFFLIVLFAFMEAVSAQQPDPKDLAARVMAYKQDIRGPYKDLRWHCTDGSIRAPRDPCPEAIGPGVQHARYKDEVIALAKDHHLYFGQILAATDPVAFWDVKNNHSRIKQYQLGKYLESIDDGWILRKAQYYRGAVQSEDEQAWGIAFYKGLLKDKQLIGDQFFLIRQTLKAIPHNTDDNLAQKIRSQSKVISDSYAPFMDLRVKIHGKPEATDLAKVRGFRQNHQGNLSPALLKEFDGLIQAMGQFYRPQELRELFRGLKNLKESPLARELWDISQGMPDGMESPAVVRTTAEILLKLRKSLPEESHPASILELLDLSLKLEELLFKNAQNWSPTTLEQTIDKICHLGMAATGAGYLELWEWQALEGSLSKTNYKELPLSELSLVLEGARSAVEWSAAMIKAHYEDVVSVYSKFEILANGFVDDQIRGSIALNLGQTTGVLGDFIAKEAKLTNRVMNLANQSSIRGLNPGYAFGELVVVEGNAEDIEVSPDKIYLFERSPSDLKPVAGIATVAEGNLVSHVQLLARNLGIPNAALSDENLRQLKGYDGQKIFYAVSNKGNVIMKPASGMSAEEKALFEKKERKEEKIAVPVNKIQLSQARILNMRSVDADDSGILCGPKAANLGQLKKLFPEQVVEGLVIPFGIFRDHMNLKMPGQSGSYWDFLSEMFREAEKLRAQNIPEPEVEHYQLRQLETLRGAIKDMTLRPGFISSLEEEFQKVLGKPLGEIPVFLRSDTNMEDLKDFTGAGLNLTLFNVVDRNKILQGIKDVWASPYTERSFKWRQRYLSNPENVFPSILVIPSVDVDCSGVMITKGINAGGENDLTIAFSRGAGGAVEGQLAETYLLEIDGGHRLLAPAREPYYNRLPTSGGTERKAAHFSKPILNAKNLDQLRSLAQMIRRQLSAEGGSGYQGAWDVELGFTGDTLWLFQIRPFVENRKALSSGYLESITPKIDGTKKISLSTRI